MSEDMIERAAKAWLKAEYYDSEPEMYDGLDDFWGRHDKTDPWWAMGGMLDARGNAREAIKAAFDPVNEDVRQLIWKAICDEQIANQRWSNETLALAIMSAIFSYAEVARARAA